MITPICPGCGDDATTCAAVADCAAKLREAARARRRAPEPLPPEMTDLLVCPACRSGRREESWQVASVVLEVSHYRVEVGPFGLQPAGYELDTVTYDCGCQIGRTLDDDGEPSGGEPPTVLEPCPHATALWLRGAGDAGAHAEVATTLEVLADAIERRSGAS